eukprot:PhF_6_TR7888/c0_g1_i1/m.11602
MPPTPGRPKVPTSFPSPTAAAKTVAPNQVLQQVPTTENLLASVMKDQLSSATRSNSGNPSASPAPPLPVNPSPSVSSPPPVSRPKSNWNVLKNGILIGSKSGQTSVKTNQSPPPPSMRPQPGSPTTAPRKPVESVAQPPPSTVKRSEVVPPPAAPAPAPPSITLPVVVTLVLRLEPEGTEFRLTNIELTKDTLRRVKQLIARAMRSSPEHVGILLNGVPIPNTEEGTTLSSLKINQSSQLSVRLETVKSTFTPRDSGIGGGSPYHHYSNSSTPKFGYPGAGPTIDECSELEQYRYNKLQQLKTEAFEEARKAREIQIRTALELENVRRDYLHLSLPLESISYVHETPFQKAIDVRISHDVARTEAIRDELTRSAQEYDMKRQTLDRRAQDLQRETEMLIEQKRAMHIEEVRKHNSIRSPPRVVPSADVQYGIATDVSRQWHNSEVQKEKDLMREIESLQDTLLRNRKAAAVRAVY